MNSQTRNAYFAMLLIAVGVLSAGCGKRKHKSDNDNTEVPRSADQELGLNESNASQLVGTYELPENRQVRLEIDQTLLVATNLIMPSPNGNNTRLTPRFPQALRYDKALNIHTAIGTFNDGTDLFKNVELRVRLYNQDKFLDVTLITPPRLACSQSQPVDHQADPGQADSCHEKHDPAQNPGHDPCNCQCPAKDQLIYVYRFERVEA